MSGHTSSKRFTKSTLKDKGRGGGRVVWFGAKPEKYPPSFQPVNTVRRDSACNTVYSNYLSTIHAMFILVYASIVSAGKISLIHLYVNFPVLNAFVNPWRL